jgi:hypothetical protein
MPGELHEAKSDPVVCPHVVPEIRLFGARQGQRVEMKSEMIPVFWSKVKKVSSVLDPNSGKTACVMETPKMENLLWD